MSALNGDLAGVLWRPVVLRRVTSGAKDRYGVVIDSPGDPETHQGYFEVTAATETAGTDRERREEALLVLWPDVQPKARDVFEVDGEPWLVSGEPRTFAGFAGGAPHHTEVVLLRAREGP